MINTTLDTILSRRSIRKFKDSKIPEEKIKDLLKAAMNAPSACNQQIWHFVVIEDRDILNELSNIHGGYHTLRNTPVAILVCGEPGAATLEFYWEHDCAAASQNILLAAQSFGLGSVWQGVTQSAEKDIDIIRRCLHLPENIKPFSIIALGYPNETIPVRSNFKEDKIHYNSRW